MMIKSLFRLRKKPSKETGLKQLYLVSLSKWDQQGKYFTADQLIKILRSYYNSLSGSETFPTDWEIIEYQLVETRSTNLEWFIRHKSKQPFIREI